MLCPVIIAGGSGTRLWPMSCEVFPKQLIPLTSERSMLQDTILRFADMNEVTDPIVVCNHKHRFMIAEQLQDVGVKGRIILEPCGRNTAPALALAAFEVVDDNPMLLVMPADHVIRNDKKFWRAAQKARAAAEDGFLVTFGINPSSPETGYGYIKLQDGGGGANGGVVEAFVEKPDIEKARKYVASGEYLWNSGIFMFRAAFFLEQLAEHSPVIYEKARAAYEKREPDLDFIRIAADDFSSCPDGSIDYAVMEKTTRAWCVPLDCGWSDVGSWDSLWEASKKDNHGNVISGNVVGVDLKNCCVKAGSRLVAAVGLENMVVVETADALLVIPRQRSQDVKAVVRILKGKGRNEAAIHCKVYRPWGAYECIDSDQRFQVKRITVKPGARLSYQLHHHRAEHWIVVKGTAKVTNGNKVITLSENQSTYIPLGEKHRLENPGVIPLELIEVQSGSYLGEDDIVRFEDVDGRENANAADS